MGAAEDDPQADPADEKTQVHGIPDVAIKAHDNQFLRWSDGSGRAVAGAAEVPDATESHRETENGRGGSEPAPLRGTRSIDMEA